MLEEHTLAFPSLLTKFNQPQSPQFVDVLQINWPWIFLSVEAAKVKLVKPNKSKKHAF